MPMSDSSDRRPLWRPRAALVLLTAPALALTLQACSGDNPVTPGSVSSVANSLQSQAASAASSLGSQAASAAPSLASQAASAGSSLGSQAASAGSSLGSQAASAGSSLGSQGASAGSSLASRGASAGSSVASRGASAASSANAAPAPGASGGATASGSATGAGSGVSLTVDGQPLNLAAAAAGGAGLSNAAGKSIEAKGVPVQSVTSDEGFWVGTGEDQRVFVQLVGSGESSFTVEQGDRIDFSGTIEQHGANFANRRGVSAAEGADMLRQQGAHVQVQKDQIKVSS